jgi:hypothetical protein
MQRTILVLDKRFQSAIGSPAIWNRLHVGALEGVAHHV